MRSLHRHRRWLSGWLVGLLLFTQWLTASYACPGPAAAGPAVVAMAAMPDCSGEMPALDPEQPQRCKAHCEAGRQSVNSGAVVPDLPAALAQGGALLGVFDMAEAAELASAMPPTLAAGPPGGAAPLYLRLLVLRN